MQTWRPSPEASTTVTVSASSCSLILVSIDCTMGDSVGPACPGADDQAENPLLRALPDGGGGGDRAVNRAEEEEERATAAWRRIA